MLKRWGAYCKYTNFISDRADKVSAFERLQLDSRQIFLEGTQFLEPPCPLHMLIQPILVGMRVKLKEDGRCDSQLLSCASCITKKLVNLGETSIFPSPVAGKPIASGCMALIASESGLETRWGLSGGKWLNKYSYLYYKILCNYIIHFL